MKCWQCHNTYLTFQPIIRQGTNPTGLYVCSLGSLQFRTTYPSSYFYYPRHHAVRDRQNPQSPCLFAYAPAGTSFTGPFAPAGNVPLHLEMNALLKDSEDFTVLRSGPGPRATVPDPGRQCREDRHRSSRDARRQRNGLHGHAKDRDNLTLSANRMPCPAIGCINRWSRCKGWSARVAGLSLLPQRRGIRPDSPGNSIQLRFQGPCPT
jgi:hypothetical protein